MIIETKLFFWNTFPSATLGEKSLDWLKFESVAANHWKESLTHNFVPHKDHMMSISYCW